MNIKLIVTVVGLFLTFALFQNFSHIENPKNSKSNVIDCAARSTLDALAYCAMLGPKNQEQEIFLDDHPGTCAELKQECSQSSEIQGKGNCGSCWTF